MSEHAEGETIGGALVSVCICTFRRPAGVARALESVLAQAVPQSWTLEVIVVDNDPDGSAAKVVADLAQASDTPVRYVVESQSGVSHARNRCLAETRGELVAFLDDDEWASDGWLTGLVEQLLASRADAVFGPVCPEYATPPALWLVASGIHQRPRYASGTQISWGDARTGNVLFRRGCAGVTGGFDIRFARTGGEDSLFFARAAERGARLVWCDDAVVTEAVPMERMTRRWVMRRAFHGGRTYARVHAQLAGPRAYVLFGMRGILAAFVSFPVALVLWLRGSERHMFYARRAVGGLGKLAASFHRGGDYAG